MKELYEKLMNLQQALQVGKNRQSKNYSYRNLSDILTAVKPKLLELNLVMYFEDKAVEIGGRYYIQSEVTLLCTETLQALNAKGICREPDSQAGIGAGQLTGATSSYARKYCLAGLFLLEDEEDNDLDKLQEKTERIEKEEQKMKKDDELKRAILGKNISQLVEGDKSKCIKILETITSFVSKDGEIIAGIKELKALNGKRLNIAYARISKIMELESKEQQQQVNDILKGESK